MPSYQSDYQIFLAAEVVADGEVVGRARLLGDSPVGYT
jgi:hypothetical protein